MSFEELQLAWQRDRASVPPPKMNPAALAKVRADSRRFTRRIFWRDVREIVAALFVALVLGRVAWSAHAEGSPSWPAWVAAAFPLGVAAYFVIDRWITKRRQDPQEKNVLAEIDRAKRVVDHQIHLLSRLVWWYLLPLVLSGVFLVLQVVLYAPMNVPPALALGLKITMAVIGLLPVILLNWWVLKQNPKAVRENLRPRSEELAGIRRELLSTN